jgi:MFS superfamily sulfate permease-like transporter
MSLLVGGIALAILILGKISLKHKPVALFVVIEGIVAASILSLETRGVKLSGAVPQGIPPLKVPALYWRDLNELLPLALACFLLGAVETAAIGRCVYATGNCTKSQCFRAWRKHSMKFRIASSPVSR